MAKRKNWRRRPKTAGDPSRHEMRRHRGSKQLRQLAGCFAGRLNAAFIRRKSERL
jgi:hypothetical protein